MSLMFSGSGSLRSSCRAFCLDKSGSGAKLAGLELGLGSSRTTAMPIGRESMTAFQRILLYESVGLGTSSTSIRAQWSILKALSKMYEKTVVLLSASIGMALEIK